MVFDENDLDAFYDTFSINFGHPSKESTYLGEIYLSKPLPGPKYDKKSFFFVDFFAKIHVIKTQVYIVHAS